MKKLEEEKERGEKEDSALSVTGNGKTKSRRRTRGLERATLKEGTETRKKQQTFARIKGGDGGGKNRFPGMTEEFFKKGG